MRTSSDRFIAIFWTLAVAIGGLWAHLQSSAGASSQEPPAASYLIRPARVFDGESSQLHEGWVVLVRGEKIEAVGPAGEVKAPAEAKPIDLPETTLLPGLIEAH